MLIQISETEYIQYLVIPDLAILQSEHCAGGEGDARGEADGLQWRPGHRGLSQKLKWSGFRTENCHYHA